jgi:hypothetical protein
MSIALVALLKIIILASFKQFILPDKTSYIALETPGSILPTETAVSAPDDIRPEPVDKEMFQNQCSHLSNIICAHCGKAYVQIIVECIAAHPSTSGTDLGRIPSLHSVAPSAEPATWVDVGRPLPTCTEVVSTDSADYGRPRSTDLNPGKKTLPT